MRIIFHVGPHKTATTSIQRLLASNRQALAEFGIQVPESQTAMRGFHELPWSILGWDTRLLHMRNRPRSARDLLTRELTAAIAAERTQVIFSAEDLSLLSVSQWQDILSNCRSILGEQYQPEFLITWTNRPVRDWVASSYSSLVMHGLNLAFHEVSGDLSRHFENFIATIGALAELDLNLKVLKVDYAKERFLQDWLDNVFSGLALSSKLSTEIAENRSPSLRQIEALRIANLKCVSSYESSAPFNWPEWHSPRSHVSLKRKHARILKKMRRAFRKRIAKENAGLLPVEICAVFRNEAEFLAEWVQFHLDEGVSKFHLFDDASTDNFAEILKSFVSAGVVNVSPAEGRHQVELYNLFLNQNKGRKVWAAFIDIDEFLFAPQGQPLPSALRRYSQWAGVFVFWKIFGAGNRQSSSGQGVISDCTLRHAVAQNRKEAVAHNKIFREIADGKLLTGRADQGKSVVRLDRVNEMLIHCPSKSRGRVVDTRGKRFSRRKWASVWRTRSYLPSHQHLLIHHYWSRSLDSLENKHARSGISEERRRMDSLKPDLEQLLSWDKHLSTTFDESLHNRLALRDQPRVFVIGFNKTATRAFEAFFNENGLPAVHWDQNRLTEKILDNVETGKRLLDGYDSDYRVFTDMISSSSSGSFEGNQFFREFDRDYPDSFFILNNRNTEDWVKCRELHGQGMFLRRELDLLGSNDLERVKQLWRNLKTSHEANVREYFSGNQRFAEIDIDSSDVPEQISRLLGLNLDATKWRLVGKTPANN